MPEIKTSITAFALCLPASSVTHARTVTRYLNQSLQPTLSTRL